MVQGCCCPAPSISIHALREEGDDVVDARFKLPQISIHALREEGDFSRPTSFLSNLHFYPRPPRGGRLFSALFASETVLFLSTPSARRATSFLPAR